jgi:hypothetical protein
MVALVAACSTSSTTEQVANPDELKPLAFWGAGPVSRKDIEGRLGVPWSAYENGRIVICHFDAVTEPLRRAECPDHRRMTPSSRRRGRGAGPLLTDSWRV